MYAQFSAKRQAFFFFSLLPSEFYLSINRRLAGITSLSYIDCGEQERYSLLPLQQLRLFIRVVRW